MPPELPALNAHEPHWQRTAIRLARSRTPFAVTNFNAARDGKFYFSIRGKYHLKATINYETGRVHFQPSVAATGPAEQRLKFRVSTSPAGSGVRVDFVGLENARKDAPATGVTRSKTK